jgi:phosphatidylinositol alpha-1,6-mannosyltransferase
MNRSERYKGHDELIVAWPRVVARVPDAQLVIVGAGDDEKRLRKAGVDSGAGDRILFTGFVASSDLDALYQRAALFALPSRGEGFGLVYLEAMRHRLPCIGSVHDAAREVIVDGVTGSLVGQEDPAALADAITSLLLDPERRKRTGDAGHLRLVSEFSFERFRSRMGELLAGRDGAAASVGR